MLRSLTLSTALFLATATLSHAATWTLSGGESKIASGSVKKDTVGEVHHFKNVSGSVDGVSKLTEVANLPGITRVSPVTLQLVFAQTGEAESVTVPATFQVAELTGDVKKGKKVFRKCRACHVADSDKNKVGPSLQGVIGRKIASVEGFKYSEAFQNADITWNTETLTEFLTKPKSYIKGTKMAFGGLKKPEDILNVIAYLESESE